MFAIPYHKNSFFLSLLKSRSLKRLEIWSSLKSLRHVSTNKYQNHFIQSINCRKDRTDIRTTVALPLRHWSKTLLSINCLIRQTISSLSTMAFTIDRRGQENTTDYRIYYSKSLNTIFYEINQKFIFNSMKEISVYF